MAMNMEALLRVAAKVTGAAQVSALGDRFKAVEGAAKRLASTSGLLGGTLGTLAPVTTIAGLGAMVTKTIDTADALNDLSERTGVGVVRLAQFRKAAATTGTSLETVVGALGRLSKAMYSAAAGSRVGEMTKEEMDKAVDAINDGEKRQIDILRRRNDRAVDEVRNGERRQTEEVQRQAEKRIQELEDESDARLKEISRRYRQEEKLLSDRFDDRNNAEERAAEQQTDQQTKATQRYYEGQRRAVEAAVGLNEVERQRRLDILRDQEDQALQQIRYAAQDQARARQRALRDAQDSEEQILSDRQDAEEEAVRRAMKAQVDRVKEGAKAREDAIQESFKRQEEFLRQQYEQQTAMVSANAKAAADELRRANDPAAALGEQMDELGLNGKQAAQVFRELGLSVKDSAGNLKNPGDMMVEIAQRIKGIDDPAKRAAYAIKLFGRGGLELIPMFDKYGDGISKLKVAFSEDIAKAADNYKDTLITLGGAVGSVGLSLTQLLLPALQAAASGMEAAVKFFLAMPKPIQTVVSLLAGLAVAFTALSPAIIAFVSLFTTLGTVMSGLTIGATIAGWLSAIGPLVAALGTFIAGIVGWPVLIGVALVAVGALLYSFRDQITAVLGAIGKAVMDAADGANKAIRAAIGAAWDWLKGRFDALLGWVQGVADGAGRILGGIGDVLRSAFAVAVDGVKDALRGVLQFMADRLNFLIGLVNNVIRGFNALPAPDIPELPAVRVPQFAAGAYVTGATKAIVGEAGPEYVIPAARMASASKAYLQGSRGIDVVNGRASGGPGGAVAINIQTGPVMQQGGQDWVTVSDLEAALDQTASALMRSMRTPGARLAMGG